MYLVYNYEAPAIKSSASAFNLVQREAGQGTVY